VAGSRRSQEQPDARRELRVDPAEFTAQIEQRIAEVRKLIEPRPGSVDALKAAENAFASWDEYNEEMIRQAFTTDTLAVEYRGYKSIYDPGRAPLSFQFDHFVEDVQSKIQRLESLAGRLSLFPKAGQPISTSSSRMPTANEIFVVHGHDVARRHEVVALVEAITSMRAIVLHEQPNLSRTIIEKFEAQASRAAFAVVILTGDDEGRERGSKFELKGRARQNVVFEMGFFAGALGRSRVAILYEPGVELPSDLHGLLYTELDSAGAWKLGLARELKAAGIGVDLNKLV
jgi:predicted nucleotide-binding protein